MYKKMMTMALALILAMSFMFSVSAETSGLNQYETALMQKLSQTFTINGKTGSLPAEQLNQARNYFISSADLTEAQYKEVSAIVDKGIALIKTQNTTDVKAFSATVKTGLLDYAEEAAAVVDLSLTYDGKNITITDSADKTVFVNAPVIKVTGAAVDPTSSVVVLGVMTTMLIACYAASKKMGLFSK